MTILHGDQKSYFSPFLTAIETAQYLRLAPRTLANLRWNGRGPEFRKHGSRVFYHVDELIKWSENRRRRTSPGDLYS